MTELDVDAYSSKSKAESPSSSKWLLFDDNDDCGTYPMMGDNTEDSEAGGDGCGGLDCGGGMDCDSKFDDDDDVENVDIRERGGVGEDEVGGEGDDDDLISLNSYNSAGGPWPAFLPGPSTSGGSPGSSKMASKKVSTATVSSTSLRSQSSRRMSTGTSRQSFSGLM